jgi:hypothetical protein
MRQRTCPESVTRAVSACSPTLAFHTATRVPFFWVGLADRISALHLGQVIANGAAAKIRANLYVQRAYLGRTNMAQDALTRLSPI